MNIDILRGGRWPEDNFDIPRFGADYDIRWTEGTASNPDIAHRAQQVHGISYSNYGYFEREALTSDGRLPPELDGTRERPGLDVAYLLAVPRGEGIDKANATIRVGDGTMENLPTFKYCREKGMSDFCEDLLELEASYRDGPIREVMALGSIGVRGRKGAYELMRAVTQNCTIKHTVGGIRELYLISLTSTSKESVLSFVGQKAVIMKDDPVRIFEKDKRANSQLYVTPALIDPSVTVDDTVERIEACVRANREVERQSLHNHLLFLVDGLTPEQMGSRAAAYLQSNIAA